MKESSDGETLMAVGTWFQIWGAADMHWLSYTVQMLSKILATSYNQ